MDIFINIADIKVVSLMQIKPISVYILSAFYRQFSFTFPDSFEHNFAKLKCCF